MVPEIIDYIDYRKFLSDFYNYSKSKHFYFSYQYLAQKVNMDASNIAKVISGKRHLPKSSIPKFRRVCEFNDREYDYFVTMIDWAKCRNDTKAKVFFEKMIQLQGSQPRILEINEYEFYSTWYHSAIYSLLDCIEFKGNFRYLCSKLTPTISLQQAKESIALLLKLGLIQVDQHDRYIPTDKRLSSGEIWKSYAIQSFQRASLNLAIKSLDNVNKDDRDISTLTFSGSKEDLLVIKKITKEYRQSIMDHIAKSNNADKVYQLNIQLFPLSN